MRRIEDIEVRRSNFKRSLAQFWPTELFYCGKWRRDNDSHFHWLPVALFPF